VKVKTRRAPAKGNKNWHLRRVMIRFDDSQFRAIAALAHRDGTSFAEQVRTLCAWGIAEDHDE
jgi:hypothetical protein